MIAVIADDFTGAAEVGGIALRQGLSVIVDTTVPKSTSADVLIIATDTRSKKSAEAVKIIQNVTRDLLALQPEWIYKKTDSLLRGNVAEELLAQLLASDAQKVLLIPANPALKRTIKAGVYYSDGVPLKDSSLADISKERIGTSTVLELLNEAYRSICVVSSTDQPLPIETIVIGNTESEADLEAWAAKLEAGIIPAGGSNFFGSLLNKNLPRLTVPPHALSLGKKALYVCGSAFPVSREAVRLAENSGQYVAYMPKDIFCLHQPAHQMIGAWSEEIINALSQNTPVIMAVDTVECGVGPLLSIKIREAMAATIKMVKDKVAIDELFIEGGATTFCVIESLGYTKFYPVQELAPGVIRMKVEEEEHLYLTLKPGSYQWPLAVWNFSYPAVKATGS
jgi:D-threonate/D-erythronate kinase